MIATFRRDVTARDRPVVPPSTTRTVMKQFVAVPVLLPRIGGKNRTVRIVGWV